MRPRSPNDFARLPRPLPHTAMETPPQPVKILVKRRGFAPPRSHEVVIAAKGQGLPIYNESIAHLCPGLGAQPFGGLRRILRRMTSVRAVVVALLAVGGL